MEKFEQATNNMITGGNYPPVEFPKVSTSILRSLPSEKQETYLQNAIEHAKQNSANLGIPFMILHDGRSSMLKVDEGRVAFWDKPEDWKKAQLTAVQSSLTGPTHDGLHDENKMATNKIRYRERLQKIFHIPTSHHAFVPQDLPPMPTYAGNAVYSHSLEKAHSILGIPSPQALSSPSIQDQSPRKRRNSVAPSPIYATQKPLPSTPTRHSIAMTDSTILEHASKRDSDISDVTIKPSSGQSSPTKEANRTPKHKSRFENLKLPREAQDYDHSSETSSLSGDDISAGFTTHWKQHEVCSLSH